MCGIYGLISTKKIDNLLELSRQMSNALLHRGPDENGEFSHHSKVLLGMNRLIIIDLQKGNVPLFNEDRSLCIVYNGEIYNYRSLRKQLTDLGHRFSTKTDTETILHAFEQYGPDCLNKLNGMFSIAIYDLKNNYLFIARDRLGIKPLYYYQNDNSLFFASELKAILNIIPQKKIDWNAISSYFTLGHLPTGQTPVQKVKKLLPGTFAWYRDEKFDIKSYWPTKVEKSEDNFQTARMKVEELIDRSVKNELISDVPIGVFLSGGLDSSAIAHFARKHKSDIQSFGLSFLEKTHNESNDAKLVADHLGMIHNQVLFDQELQHQAFSDVFNILDEPFADPTVLPLYALSQFAKKHVTVVLTGWGGDEIFAGYQTYRAHLLAQKYRKIPAHIQTLISLLINKLPVSDKYMSFEFRAKKFIQGMENTPQFQHYQWMGYLDNKAQGQIFTNAVLDNISINPLRQILEGYEQQVEDTKGLSNDHDLINGMLHLDQKYFLEGNGLFQADRMTMAASLEARVPLLNTDLIEYLNSLPSSIKMHNGREKTLLKEVLRPYLPEKIIMKAKKGFGPPTSQWLRGPYSKILETIFQEDRVKDQNIFNYNAIIKMYKDHKERKHDFGRELWMIMSFQLWYERFILNNSLEKRVNSL
jgi:asparagine synthase (glutamine-hydrolysing)